MKNTLGLHRVSSAELQRLVRSIYKNHFEFPISRRGLMLAKFGDLEGHLSPLVGLDRHAALTVLSAVLQARGAIGQAPSADSSAAGQGLPSSAAFGGELLWQGPGSPGHGHREPLALVQQWIAEAEQSILWSGIPVSARHRAFQSLHAAQRGRSLAVTLILVGTVEEGRKLVEETFVHGAPRPTCFVAPPETVIPPTCLVMDNSRLLWFGSDGDLLDQEDDGPLRSAIALQQASLAGAMTEQLQHLCTAAHETGYVAL